MQTNYIKIKPFDTLFFNTGRPFTKGEDTWVNSSLMPNPSVVWGALASHLFSKGKIPDEIKKDLKVKELYLFDEETQKIFINAPLDIFSDKSGNQHTEKYETKNDLVNVISNVDFTELVYPDTDEQVENNPGYLLDLLSLRNYYQKNGYYFHLYPIDELILANPKVGIQRNNQSRTSEDGKLYRIDMQEFHQDLSIVVKIETGFEFDNHGVLKLGGESKAADFQMLENAPYEIEKFDTKLQPEIEKGISEFVKVLFTTPVFANENFYQFDNDKLQLATSVLGKPVNIGGWDYDTGKPKPMKKAFPAGSVLTFNLKKELKSNEIKNEIEVLFKTDSYGFGIFKLLKI